MQAPLQVDRDTYTKAVLERDRPLFPCSCQDCECDLRSYTSAPCVLCKNNKHAIGRTVETQIRRRRTPHVTIELQLWPPPPPKASPYWWGYHELSFYEDHVEVWRARIPEAGQASGAARVRRDHAFGWLLVLELTREKAREVLAALKLENPPGAVDLPRLTAADCEEGFP